MSLKAIAEQELARLKAGETPHETESETQVKQLKHEGSCFIDARTRFMLLKQDERQKTGKNADCFIVSSPKGETRETSLPGPVADGLKRLRVMRPPQLLMPDQWQIAVAGATHLAESGWAANALALGWSPLDLFGAVGARDGDPDGDGLAVWLAGREVLAICATFASVQDGAGRSYYNRRERTGARLLWEL